MRLSTCLPLLLLAAGCLAGAADPAGVREVRRGFERPPEDARIMMRWWWFGPAVTKSHLELEMRTMKSGGIGGFEVQPVYPLWLDDPDRGVRNLPYLSAEFIDALRFTAQKARELGLRFDLTLGSGWPFGGPHIPVTQAAGRLRCERVPAPEAAHTLPLPDLAAGESFIAAFLARGDRTRFDPQGIRRLEDIQNGLLRLPAERSGPHVVLFFIASRTGQQVKRAALGAEGFVFDHYDRAAVDNHLKNVGDRLFTAFSGEAPYAVFSDSLEVFASDWTGDLLGEFRKRRGYDLTPYLPALVGDMGEKTAAIRHDWGLTLVELAEERYLAPLTAWARRHGTRFRSQTYGVPPVRLSSNALVDLPEGEGAQWRAFSATRWAASANHLYGRAITSSETWTWLDSPAFRATPLDMKAEADLHFLSGVNQLVGHGWPYSPDVAGRPGWRFYAAAVFNDHNPWWIVMPDITLYLQRMSYLLRQGKPADDVAVYLPIPDALAQFTAGRVSVDGSMDALLGPTLIPQILDTGYNFDFVDDRAIEKIGLAHRVLILPNVERIPLATYRRLAEFVERGGILVATRRLPSLAPGLSDSEQDTTAVRVLSGVLFESSGAKAHLVRDERTLGAELAKLLPPDFAAAAPEVGFLHRRLGDAELYFIANTSNHAIHTGATVRVARLEPQWWDPFSTHVYSARFTQAAASTAVEIDLEPYESRVLVFAPDKLDAEAPPPPATHQGGTDLSADWRVSFTGLAHSEVMMPRLRSWVEDEETRYFSGEAVYEKTIFLPALKAEARLFLDFGAGTPMTPVVSGNPGMRAWLESPVREAALVVVNGQAAGSVWRPPYELDITRFLHAGENRIRITVANTAINALAGRPLPSYRLLNLRYGERFTPQGMENVQPLASGLLGDLRLETR